MKIQWVVLVAAVVGMLIAALIVIAPNFNTGINNNMDLLCDVAKDEPDPEGVCDNQ